MHPKMNEAGSFWTSYLIIPPGAGDRAG